VNPAAPALSGSFPAVLPLAASEARAESTEVGRVSVSPSTAALRASRSKEAEHVLCVPRTTIFPDGAWHGLVTRGLERVLRTIRAASEYRPRHLVEEDPAQQQVIPYCLVQHPDGTYLLTRRLRRSSERRLHNLYSLGVGGHINPGDGVRLDPMVGGLAREWSEEIVCPAPATARLVAVLNDDSTPVARHHLGLVFLVAPEEGRVSIRETDKLEGEAMTLEAMRPLYLSMETWSQLCYDDLVSGAPERAERSPLVVELAPAP
jgi:predicted NUDIX family phosphoesterase